MVTGATGHLGTLVMDALLGMVDPKEIAVSVRTVEKAQSYLEKGVDVRQGDFDEPEMLVHTFKDVERLLIISTDGDNATRIRQHAYAIESAKKAGVKFIVYTSVANADQSKLFLAEVHQKSEEAIINSGIDYTILRNNWYLENEVSSVQGVLAGAPWVTSAKDGKVGWALREDYALAAATVLVAGEKHNNMIYELSGTLHTQDEIAKEVGNVLGKAIEVLQVDDKTYEEIMLKAGVPESLMPLLLGIQEGIRNHELEVISNDFEKIIGRKPIPLETAVQHLVKMAQS
jgi:NAD(P)H dehydrogenase (quinone)